MTPLFKKLNLKDQQQIVIVDAPESFERELAGLEGVEVFRAAKAAKNISFAIAFVRTLAEVEKAAASLTSRSEPDAVIWFAYPKGTSKKYRCEFNRDNGWQALFDAGFEGVRMVAIDEDWSALRFRRVEHIKSMTRETRHAGSAAGKARTKS